MRAILLACAAALLFTALAQAQTGTPNGGYIRTPGGFMVPASPSPQGSPYVANPPSYPYVRPALPKHQRAVATTTVLLVRLPPAA